MAEFQNKDIERVCRLGGVSRLKAVELLRRHGGKPERVMIEHFGRARVYVEPLCIQDARADWRDAMSRAGQRLASCRLTVNGRMGLPVFSAPLWPTLAVGVLTAPFSVAAVLGIWAAGCRFSVDWGNGEGACPDMR